MQNILNYAHIFLQSVAGYPGNLVESIFIINQSLQIISKIFSIVRVFYSTHIITSALYYWQKHSKTLLFCVISGAFWLSFGCQNCVKLSYIKRVKLSTSIKTNWHYQEWQENDNYLSKDCQHNDKKCVFWLRFGCHLVAKCPPSIG